MSEMNKKEHVIMCFDVTFVSILQIREVLELLGVDKVVYKIDFEKLVLEVYDGNDELFDQINKLLSESISGLQKEKQNEILEKIARYIIGIEYELTETRKNAERKEDSSRWVHNVFMSFVLTVIVIELIR